MKIEIWLCLLSISSVRIFQLESQKVKGSNTSKIWVWWQIVGLIACHWPNVKLQLCIHAILYHNMHLRPWRRCHHGENGSFGHDYNNAPPLVWTLRRLFPGVKLWSVWMTWIWIWIWIWEGPNPNPLFGKLKRIEFGFGPNPSWIWGVQIHGFEIPSKTQEFRNLSLSRTLFLSRLSVSLFLAVTHELFFPLSLGKATSGLFSQLLSSSLTSLILSFY